VLEHPPVPVAVIAWAQLEHGRVEQRMNADPAAVAGLGDCAGDAPAPARLVDVAPAQPLELADAHPGRVEQEQRQTVGRCGQPVDALDVGGGRRLDLGALLARQPKVGKSTVVYALLARLVAGVPFVGLDTFTAGVLVLTEERRDALAEKARILESRFYSPRSSPIGGNKKPAHVLLRHEAGSTPWPQLVRQAMAYCHQHELRCLVVDTWDRWTSLRGDAENAAGAVNEALEPLQYAAASALAVLIVSHQRKSLGEFGEAVRGSNALTGGVDVVLELERPKPSPALGKHAQALRAVSRFSSTPDELYVELDEDAAEFVVLESPEEVKAAVEQTRIVEVLAGLDGATSATVAETIELPDSTVRRHLNVLLERGHVVREGLGKRGDPFRWRTTDTENGE
jgi:AAA domain/Helix-turn-helix domain